MLRKLVNHILYFIKIKPKPEDWILNYHIHPTSIIYKKINVLIHSSALICEHVIIRAPIGKLSIGEKSQIGPFTVIFTDSDIQIGKDVMIAPHCVIASGNHDYTNIEIPMIQAGGTSAGPIVIGDDVWIGSNCTIIDNVKIGKGAIIAANSLVNRNVGDYEIFGGVPAKFIKSRI
jgi:acetyltransferase-like isoleucine patch superfamily enzyme